MINKTSFLLQIIALFLLGLMFVLPGSAVAQENGANLESLIEEVQDVAPDEPSDEEVEADEENEEEAGVDDELSQIRELISFGKILYSLILLFGAYFLNKYLNLVLDKFSEKATDYRLIIKRIAPISRIVIWTLTIYVIIAGIIAPPFETVITIVASVGIAVGFASQDILKNIFGGIIIILDRPFQVGDKIEAGDHYGEVLSIGLRSCRIVTPDDSIVSIPNGELMNRAVSNANSSALDCQVVAEIFLPATADVNRVKEIAYRAVYASSYSYLNKPVSVIALNEIHERQFVLKLRVKAYVIDIRYEFPFKSDMTEMILSECNRLGMIDPATMQANVQEAS
ncbi:MAG: mechanosensitive ion channel family protein [Balneolaceae bacterium]